VVCPGNIDSDAEAIQELAGVFGKSHPGMVASVEEPLSYDETKYVIGLCDYFAGARMHACIAALSQAVPCSALAYSGKFEGVMASVGADSITIDMRRTDRETALRLIVYNYQQRSELRQVLGRRMPEVRQAIAPL
jgi:polysaccharide pyruvyl transferase WcaK-like protein